MELKLEKKILDLHFDGKQYEVKFPSAGGVSQFEDLFNEASSNKEKLDCICDFLDSLGLPKEVSTQLDMENLNKVVETLGGRKKN